ncbi:MAG: hypothetical protein HY706_22400 [Candidatus Hydrogenedentes bacterium]|nr:hypothetical protein [Candidatus Hydrogenedentota bacterium]
MKTPKIPQTDSIQELAQFWDTHDLTDFEDELEEVEQPVFERRAVVKVVLQPEEIKVLDGIAKSKGIGSDELVREWVRERIHTA